MSQVSGGWDPLPYALGSAFGLGCRLGFVSRSCAGAASCSAAFVERAKQIRAVTGSSVLLLVALFKPLPPPSPRERWARSAASTVCSGKGWKRWPVVHNRCSSTASLRATATRGALFHAFAAVGQLQSPLFQRRVGPPAEDVVRAFHQQRAQVAVPILRDAQLRVAAPALPLFGAQAPGRPRRRGGGGSGPDRPRSAHSKSAVTGTDARHACADARSPGSVLSTAWQPVRPARRSAR